MLATMEATDVLELLGALEQQGTYYWVDGGWGVDCLVGGQSRPHSDLDLVLPRAEVVRVRSFLLARGYSVIRDWLPTTIAFRDGHGREVDLHPVDMTTDGGGDQVLEDGTTWHYSAPAEGSIEGRAVRCAPAEDQLRSHLGYEPRPVDFADMKRLTERFDLRPPPPYDTT